MGAAVRDTRGYITPDARPERGPHGQPPAPGRGRGRAGQRLLPRAAAPVVPDAADARGRPGHPGRAGGGEGARPGNLAARPAARPGAGGPVRHRVVPDAHRHPPAAGLPPAAVAGRRRHLARRDGADVGPLRRRGRDRPDDLRRPGPRRRRPRRGVRHAHRPGPGRHRRHRQGGPREHPVPPPPPDLRRERRQRRPGLPARLPAVAPAGRGRRRGLLGRVARGHARVRGGRRHAAGPGDRRRGGQVAGPRRAAALERGRRPDRRHARADRVGARGVGGDRAGRAAGRLRGRGGGSGTSPATICATRRRGCSGW